MYYSKCDTVIVRMIDGRGAILNCDGCLVFPICHGCTRLNAEKMYKNMGNTKEIFLPVHEQLLVVHQVSATRYVIPVSFPTASAPA